MADRRFTRESFNKKRIIRKLQLIFIYCLFIALVISLCMLLYARVTDKNKGKKGGAVKYTVAADIGRKPVGYISYNLMITHAIAQTNPEQIEIPSVSVSGMEFEVPETVLGPVEEVEPLNWYDESLYEKNDGPADLSYFSDVCFIGDSRTEGLVLYSGLPNINGFYYKGLSVDKLSTDKVITIPGTGGSYTCFEAVGMTKFDAYYLMFGVNELGWVYVEKFTENMSNFIDYIKSINPDAVIYVQSILPVSLSSSQKSDIYNQDRVNMYNEELLKMCQTRGDVIYLDSASAVKDANGYLPEEASSDGIHCDVNYVKRLVQFYRYNTFSKKIK
ncbi:MAG: hypothetical protein IJ054_07330 [Lachnospiraceae bacterium]|nr:hypothetical protein [Lachnospiraceae bacterium]MBQ9234294.1 hypothetical protein [Lachnospiraceae bacterium]